MTFPYNRVINPHTQPILYDGYRANHLIDSPGRLRISTPLTLFEHNNQTGTNIFKWDTSTSGTGTITDGSGATMGSTILATGGTASGASAIRASRLYIHQAAGKNLWAGQSFSFGIGTANVTKRVGLFDANNGCFIEQNGTIINLVVRRAGVDTRYAQGTWTDDNLDGNGPSGILLNPAANLDLRVEMFGNDRIRFYIHLNYTFALVHSVPNTNQSPVIAPQTANLTVRAEISNNGTAAAAAQMSVGGVNVFAEGAQEQIPAFLASKNNGASPTSVTTRRPVLSLQANTLAINGIDRNFGQIIPQNLSILVTANTLIELVYNPTSLTGAAFSSVGATSIANVDTSATALTGGIVFISGYVGSSGGGSNTIGAILVNGQNLAEQFPLVYSSLKNTQDTISVVATSLSGTSMVNAALNWTEIY